MTQLTLEAIAALERGNLIEAIKITRDHTGMDLKLSKEAVERYANSSEQERAAGAVGSASRSTTEAARYLEWHRDGDPVCSGSGHAPRQPDNPPSWPTLAECAEHTQPSAQMRTTGHHATRCHTSFV